MPRSVKPKIKSDDSEPANTMHDNDDSDIEEVDVNESIREYQTLIIKTFEDMVENESLIPQQLRRIARIYFNSSIESHPEISIQLLEAVYRLSAHLLLLDQKSPDFTLWYNLLPRVWKTITSELALHCKMLDGWTDELFTLHIQKLQSTATTGIIRFLCREMASTSPKPQKLLSIQLLGQFTKLTKIDDFYLSDSDRYLVTTTLSQRLLDKALEIKQVALQNVIPFLISPRILDVLRYLAVSDPNDQIRRHALWLLYRPAFITDCMDHAHNQQIDSLIFIARMQDASIAVRSTLLQIFEEKELRITPVSAHNRNSTPAGNQDMSKKSKKITTENDQQDGENQIIADDEDKNKQNVEETDIKAVNNNNVYKTYGHLFRCDYRNSRSKLNYRQKLWVLKQGLCDPEKIIVYQTMNLITKLFCCENFDLIDFIYYLSSGQCKPGYNQQLDDKQAKESLLLGDNIVYHYNNQNVNKIWTSSISSLTSSLNSNGNSIGLIDPSSFSMQSQADGKGNQTSSTTYINDPLGLFISSTNNGIGVLNSTIYQDLCLVLSYIVCSYSWRHTIDDVERTDYCLYKRRRLVPNYAKKLQSASDSNSSTISTHDENDINYDDDDDDDLLDLLMKKTTNTSSVQDEVKENPDGNKSKTGKGKKVKNEIQDEAIPSAPTTTISTKKRPVTKYISTDDDTFIYDTELPSIKLNTRQVVLEIPNFSAIQKNTTYFFQSILHSNAVTQYQADLEQYELIMTEKANGNVEYQNLELDKPQAPADPDFDYLEHDVSTLTKQPLLTSSICLLWYLLLSSLSGQENTTYLHTVTQFQLQQRSSSTSNTSIPINYQQLKSSRPALSCPGYNNPQTIIALTQLDYIDDLKPDISTTLILLPLLDDFAQPSLTLHMLLLTYHIDFQRSSYNELLLCYNRFGHFISSPEFQNNFLPIVFLFLRSIQPIIMIRYYQQVEYVTKQLQLRNNLAGNGLTNVASDDENDEESTLPEKPRTYVAIMTQFITDFMDTIITQEYSSTEPPLEPNLFTKNLTIPGSKEHTKSLRKAHDIVLSEDQEDVSEEGEEIQYKSRYSLRQSYRTQLLLLQSQYNELRHTTLHGTDEMKRVRRGAVLKTLFNQYRNLYYVYTGHIEFLIKRLLIIVLDFFINCPVVNIKNNKVTGGNGMNIVTGGSNQTIPTDFYDEYFDFNVNTEEGVMINILHKCMYPLLGWTSYEYIQYGENVHVDEETGEEMIVHEPVSVSHFWFDLDFYSVDINFLCLQILTQSAIMSTDSTHISIILSHLLSFATVVKKQNLNNTPLLSQKVQSSSYHDEITFNNEHIMDFKAYNTTIAQTNNFSSLHHHGSVISKDDVIMNNNENLVNVLDGKGFYYIRAQFSKPAGNLGKKASQNVPIKNPYVDISRLNSFSHMFIHPVLQLYAIKSITDILITFVNLIPITAYQHSYDKLHKDYEHIYQPRQTILNLFTNDHPCNEPTGNKNLQNDVAIAPELIYQCYSVILGYAQLYINGNNDLSSGRNDLTQLYPFLEVEQTVGSIYRASTKFHYNIKRHSHLAEIQWKEQYLGETVPSSSSVTKKGTTPSKQNRGSSKHPRSSDPNQNLVDYTNQMDDDTINDNDNGDDDEVYEDYSDFEDDEFYENLSTQNLTDDSTDQLLKLIKINTKMNKDYTRCDKKTLREQYIASQSALTRILTSLTKRIHQLTRLSHEKASEGNVTSKKANITGLNAIYTGDLLCISDFGDDKSSLLVATQDVLEEKSLDGLIFPLKQMKISYDDETYARVQRIFGHLVEEQKSILQIPPSEQRNSTSGATSNKTNIGVVTKPVFDMFLHEDIFLLYKSIRSNQLYTDDMDIGNVSGKGSNKKSLSNLVDSTIKAIVEGIQDKAQKRQVKRAIPFEIIPYTYYDNPYLILRGIEDWLLEDDFFHSANQSARSTLVLDHNLQSPTTQTSTTHSLANLGINNTSNTLGTVSMYKELNNKAKLRFEKHFQFLENTKFNKYHNYNTLYHVSTSPDHLQLYTGTYISIIYQAIVNTALFSCCKLLFFNRVPYSMIQQYLSTLIISTICTTKRRTLTTTTTSTTAHNNISDTQDLLKLFFYSYIRLNFNSTILINPTNQQYVNTLHLYQNIAKKVAINKAMNQMRQNGKDNADILLQFGDIDAIHYEYASYDMSYQSTYKKWQIEHEKALHDHVSQDQLPVEPINPNLFTFDDITIQSIPILHHLKDNTELREKLWSYLSSRDQATYKHLLHHSSTHGDWGLASGVSICDHLNIIATSPTYIIYDILQQFSKNHTLTLLPAYIDYITSLLSPFATPSSTPIDYAPLKQPNAVELMNPIVQHGIYSPLSSSISPLLKFGIDLLSIINRTENFRENFVPLICVIKVIIEAISQWNILPNDFYPIFHPNASTTATSAQYKYPDDVFTNELFPKAQNKKALLEHTMASPSRRSAIGFYLFLLQIIDVYRFIKSNQLTLPHKSTSEYAKKDEKTQQQIKLVNFYNELTDNIKELISKLIYFLSLTRAPSNIAPANVKGVIGNKKGGKKAPAKKVPLAPKKRGKKTTTQEDTDDNDDNDDNHELFDDTVEKITDQDGHSSDDENTTSQDGPTSQLINYADPMIKFLNKRTITSTTISSLSNTIKSFNNPYTSNVFFLHQLIFQFSRDSSFTLDSFLSHGLNLEELTTIELTQPNATDLRSNTLLAGSNIHVDNNIEDFISSIIDQRYNKVAQQTKYISDDIWKNHFIKVNSSVIQALLDTNSNADHSDHDLPLGTPLKATKSGSNKRSTGKTPRKALIKPSVRQSQVLSDTENDEDDNHDDLPLDDQSDNEEMTSSSQHGHTGAVQLKKQPTKSLIGANKAGKGAISSSSSHRSSHKNVIVTSDIDNSDNEDSNHIDAESSDLHDEDEEIQTKPSRKVTQSARVIRPATPNKQVYEEIFDSDVVEEELDSDEHTEVVTTKRRGKTTSDAKNTQTTKTTKTTKSTRRG